MNRMLLSITIIILLFSCKSKNIKSETNDLFLKKLNSDYTIWKNEFPDSLTKHFPDKIDKNFVSFGSSYRDEPRTFLHLNLEKKLTKEEKQRFLKIQSTSDTCIIRIYANRNTYGFDKKGLGECDQYVPVPELNLISTLDPVPADLKYYILELSRQTFINHEMYLRYYLPEEWKNGMSRGVAISEKENIIFYWLIMW